MEAFLISPNDVAASHTVYICKEFPVELCGRLAVAKQLRRCSGRRTIIGLAAKVLYYLLNIIILLIEHTSRPWIPIGDGAHKADGAQVLVMGHKLLLMGIMGMCPSAPPGYGPVCEQLSPHCICTWRI